MAYSLLCILNYVQTRDGENKELKILYYCTFYRKGE